MDNMENKYSAETILTGACITKFVVETNGYQGGDAGYGSYVNIFIEDEGGTCMKVTTIPEKLGQDTIKLSFKGDFELQHAMLGFEFVAKSLREMLEKKTT
jgi:hypothetical protein